MQGPARGPRVAGLGAALVGLLACTSAQQPGPQPDVKPNEDAVSSPEQPAPPAREPAASRPADAERLTKLDARARACEHEAVRAGLAGLDLDALASAATTPASVRLHARWAAGARDAAAVEAIAEGLEAAVGQRPPDWWQTTLASGRAVQAGSATAYALGLEGPDHDRRGPLVQGPAGLRVRPDAALLVSASDGQLGYDLSTARIALGPVPAPAPAGALTLELARARAGTTVYLASFDPGLGGMRFPLRAVDPSGPRWEAEVCGPDRTVLAGLGYLIVEIVVIEPASDAPPGVMRPSARPTHVAVYTAESHGVAVDVFDPATGERVLAWSSDSPVGGGGPPAARADPQP